MSHAAISVLVFGVYALVVGLSLLLAPDILLPILGMPISEEVWVRIAGTIAAPLGIYYIQAGRKELVPFMRASLVGRAFFTISACVLAVLWALPILFLFAGIEAAGILWTAAALRKSGS